MVYKNQSLSVIGNGMKYMDLLGGFSPALALWKMMEFVSWDDMTVPIPMTDPAGACFFFNAKMTVVFFGWAPWSTIFLAAPLGSVMGYIKIITKSKKDKTNIN